MEGCTKKDVEVWYFAIWGGGGVRNCLKITKNLALFLSEGGMVEDYTF